MKKFIISIITILSALFISTNAYADELTGSFTLSNGGDISALTDDSHYSVVNFNTGDTITITADDSSISGIYITWDTKAVPWTLTTDNGDVSCGINAFLHEYVALDNASSKVTINIPADEMRISTIRIFSEGALPHDVQVWNPPCEKADIMVVASHADDEILFFGGILPTYAYVHDADIQVVYMSHFWHGQKVREHEKLDGLWESGIRNYPVCGNFEDLYSEDIATAESQYNYSDMVNYLISEIRRFTPQVVVTHDVNGEYGHGFHMLTSKAVREAVETAGDATIHTNSASIYGAWDTPKLYLHVYEENKIRLDLRTPIEEDYLNRTALDIAIAAYKEHVSQQWCWFYVSDDYKYSCADFGLYRTLVGADTTDDILCNIKTYKVQAAEEEARLKAEEESRKAEEESSREQASKEAASREESSRQEESREKASRENESSKEAELEKEMTQMRITTVSIICVAIAAVILGVVMFTIKRKNSKQ